MSKGGTIIGGLFLTAGLFFVGVALTQVHADITRAAGAEHAEGTIIAVDRQSGRKARSVYYPVIAFQDAAGIRRTFSGQAGKRRPRFTIGEKVPVIYDPANPGDAVIDSFADRHLASLIYGFLGCLFAVLGGAALLGILRGTASSQRRRGAERRSRRRR